MGSAGSVPKASRPIASSGEQKISGQRRQAKDLPEQGTGAGNHPHHAPEEEDQEDRAEKSPQPGVIPTDDNPVKFQAARALCDTEHQQAENGKSRDSRRHTRNSPGAEPAEELQQLLAGEKAGPQEAAGKDDGNLHRGDVLLQ